VILPSYSALARYIWSAGSALGSPAQETRVHAKGSAWTGTTDIQGEAEGGWTVYPGEEKARGQYIPAGGSKEKESDSILFSESTSSSQHKLKYRKFHLSIRKNKSNTFSVTVVKHWTRLPKKAVELQLLERHSKPDWRMS